jgi:cobalt-zinc-cadmium efflux system protein
MSEGGHDHGNCHAGHSHGGHTHAGHGHGGHAHGGLGHSHAPESFDRAFAIGTLLNIAFVVAELSFGYAANSLALISDAVHNVSDVIGLLLAWGGAWLARRPPTARHTFGFGRATILAALGNAILLVVAIVAIIYEAVARLLEPQPLASATVLWVAALGIVINGATALLFMRGRAGDLNVRGAFLHMMADALVSGAVVVASLLILVTGWLWLDPAMSLAVAGVVLVGTWGLGRASLGFALDAVPDDIDPAAVSACLAGLNGVVAVRELHIWAISTTETVLTAKLLCRDAGDEALLAQAGHELETRFGIRRATLQLSAAAPTQA